MRSLGMDRIDAMMKTRKIDAVKAVDQGYFDEIQKLPFLEPGGGTRWSSGRDVDRQKAARTAPASGPLALPACTPPTSRTSRS